MLGALARRGTLPGARRPAAASGHPRRRPNRRSRRGRSGATPPLELAALDGRKVALEGLKGRVVVINYWATWCEPCIDEMPSLERLRVKMKGRPFEVLAVNYGESAERVSRFVAKMKLTMPVLLDPVQELRGCLEGARPADDLHRRCEGRGSLLVLRRARLEPGRGAAARGAHGVGGARCLTTSRRDTASSSCSRAAAGDERAEVVAALLEEPARIAPKYFYDELGCALYGAICRLAGVLPDAHRARDLPRASRGAGRGDGQRQAVRRSRRRRLLQGRGLARVRGAEALRRGRYRRPRDRAVRSRAWRPISPGRDDRRGHGFLRAGSSGRDRSTRARRLSSIRARASATSRRTRPWRSLRRSAATACARPGSGLLIGVDGKKPKPVLDAAYDDALGVTAAFNRNVLMSLNRRFGFDFAHRGLRASRLLQRGARPDRDAPRGARATRR